ncbi:hypothetical protein CYMTET_13439 [Cymbomonas tetramitiformis]|uniref:Sugar phosphate transporter domain-containing protein n=1 Tax=Cymbomonas tetramitiformis TaxID=36881 RepID=A0AAE0GIH4_9CHLO|nr:hypothetical protein CYMTET_13439 [Cymbomonas tetramitiformis]
MNDTVELYCRALLYVYSIVWLGQSRLSDEEVSAVIHNSRLQEEAVAKMSAAKCGEAKSGCENSRACATWSTNYPSQEPQTLQEMAPRRLPSMENISTHQLVLGAVFMLSSSSLLLVNKGALKSIPLPFFITLVQVLSTVCILHVLRVCKTVQFDDLSRHVAKDWFVVSVVWLAPIVFNMFTLRRLNAESVIVFRAASTAGVALADWIFFKHGFQANETLGVVAIVGGSVLYTSFDLQYDAMGYVLGLVYMISMIFNLIYIKYFFEQNQSLNMWTKTYYMNMLAIPLLIVMVLAFEGSAVGELSWSSISNSGLVCLGVSCLVGLVLSASATGLRDVVSPTTFDILGNVNKFATAALSRLIFHTVNTALSSLGLAISLLGGALYAPIGKQLFGLSDAATQLGVSDTAQPGRSKALLAEVPR